MTQTYRETYGLFAVAGILYNHESPRRDARFVTRKVTRGAARIKLGLDRELHLGSLDAERDWGFAGDFVVAMHRMLQADQPDDYVLGTGQAHAVRELAEALDALLVGRAPAADQKPTLGCSIKWRQ
jgi:GDPmannose 4,6-dehydratase